MWWAVVTMTTVGYGDTYPLTFVGKLIASISFICGIILIALPVAILENQFESVYEEKERQHMKKEFQKKRMQMGKIDKPHNEERVRE